MNSPELDSVLEIAIENNDFKAIPHLIKAGANPNATSYDHNYNLLGQTVISGNIKCAKALLENGGNPNSLVNLSGNSATHTLAFYLYSAGKLMKNADQWIELFLNHQADFYQQSRSQLKMTPIEKLSDEAKEVYDRVIDNYQPEQQHSKLKM